MFLAFRDADGNLGTITEDLSVNYDGKWEQDIEQHVSEVIAEHRDEADDFERAAVFTQLVVELPEETPVRSVERRTE